MEKEYLGLGTCSVKFLGKFDCHLSHYLSFMYFYLYCSVHNVSIRMETNNKQTCTSGEQTAAFYSLTFPLTC